jgi:hypothetical protein
MHEGGISMSNRTLFLSSIAIIGAVVAVLTLPTEASAGETRRLTKNDNDRSEPVKVGADDRVEVLMGFQPGTGYRWKLAPDSTPLLVLDEPKDGEEVDEKGKRLNDRAGEGKPGQTEYRLFKLHLAENAVADPDKRNLKLILTRSGSDRAVRTYKVPIIVERPR